MTPPLYLLRHGAFLGIQQEKQEADSVVAFDAESLDAALQKGKPMMVDFYAPW